VSFLFAIYTAVVCRAVWDRLNRQPAPSRPPAGFRAEGWFEVQRPTRGVSPAGPRGPGLEHGRALWPCRPADSSPADSWWPGAGGRWGMGIAPARRSTTGVRPPRPDSIRPPPRPRRRSGQPGYRRKKKKKRCGPRSGARVVFWRSDFPHGPGRGVQIVSVRVQRQADGARCNNNDDNPGAPVDDCPTTALA